MKTCLLVIVILSLAASVKAMVPLVPSDSGMAVKVGDTVDGVYKMPLPSPPCPINLYGRYGDYLTIINTNDTDFRYWLFSGLQFHPVLTPTTLGIHRDTVHIHVYYDYGGQFSC